jgi:hypothetical protein
MEFTIKEVTVRHAGKKHGRAYVFIKNENILENLTNRQNRPTKLFRQIVEEALEKEGITNPDGMAWSQYAGCSCPCSPGFIMKNCDRDVYVDVKLKA